jgi:FMN reductase
MPTSSPDPLDPPDSQPVHPGTPPTLVVVVGNPRPGSRTATLAVELGRALARLVPAADPVVLDLADLTDRLGAPLGAGSAERWAEPLAVLHAADLILVATPTYKGSYTGLLKSFLDHVGGGALRGITAVPITTVGSPAHTLAADVHLRPLLIELGASTPTSALVVGNDQLDTPAEAISGWLTVNLDPLKRALAPTVASAYSSVSA